VTEGERALERAEARAGSAPGRAREIGRVAVIGAGTMGAGIASACLLGGFPVGLVEPDAAARERGVVRVRAALESAVKKGKLAGAELEARLARLAPAASLAELAPADLYIEAVFENLALKRELLRASNTSYLAISAIAEGNPRARDVLGLHFFSPAHIMRLVEVVAGAASAAEAVKSGAEFVRALGKLPVLAGDATGFIGNRMLQAYGRETQNMLLEGASPTDVDSALEGFGFAMGPCAVFDLAGLDVGYRARRERSDVPQDARYFRVCDLLVEAGRLGQKTGAGHYRYGEGRRREADPAVEALIRTEAARLGVARRALAREEIIERAVFALVNAGASLLVAGIARTPGDIDVVWANGYGFPRARGGPMRHADELGLPDVLAALLRLASAHGETFAPAPLIRELAARNGNFAMLNEP
jgi:3-hydroxyacyl-CoA dehydrogenase